MLDKKISALTPPKYEAKHIMAMQSLACGEATSDQQKMVLDWIINNAAGTYDTSWRPGGLEGDRETSLAEGRRFVGTQIVKLMKLNASMFSNKRQQNGEV